jgi:hypothetical protein
MADLHGMAPAPTMAPAPESMLLPLEFGAAPQLSSSPQPEVNMQRTMPLVSVQGRHLMLAWIRGALHHWLQCKGTQLMLAQ